MVVGGDRQRPVLQLGVVGLEQPGRRPGGHVGIEPLVHGLADGHVFPAGAPGELPQAGRAGLAVGPGVERRLHVRQVGQLRRQPLVDEMLFELGEVFPRADHPLVETVLLAELQADVLPGLVKGGVPLRREQGGDVLLRPGRRPFAVAQIGEDVAHPLPGRVDALVVDAGRVGRLPIHQVDHGVHPAEVGAVVEHPLTGGVAAVDVLPEGDVGPDAGVEGKPLPGSGGGRNEQAPGEQDQQAECGKTRPAGGGQEERTDHGAAVRDGVKGDGLGKNQNP